MPIMMLHRKRTPGRPGRQLVAASLRSSLRPTWSSLLPCCLRSICSAAPVLIVFSLLFLALPNSSLVGHAAAKPVKNHRGPRGARDFFQRGVSSASTSAHVEPDFSSFLPRNKQVVTRYQNIPRGYHETKSAQAKQRAVSSRGTTRKTTAEDVVAPAALFDKPEQCLAVYNTLYDPVQREMVWNAADVVVLSSGNLVHKNTINNWISQFWHKNGEAIGSSSGETGTTAHSSTTRTAHDELQAHFELAHSELFLQDPKTHFAVLFAAARPDGGASSTTSSSSGSIVKTSSSAALIGSLKNKVEDLRSAKNRLLSGTNHRGHHLPPRPHPDDTSFTLRKVVKLDTPGQRKLAASSTGAPGPPGRGTRNTNNASIAPLSKNLNDVATLSDIYTKTAPTINSEAKIPESVFYGFQDEELKQEAEECFKWFLLNGCDAALSGIVFVDNLPTVRSGEQEERNFYDDIREAAVKAGLLSLLLPGRAAELQRKAVKCPWVEQEYEHQANVGNKMNISNTKTKTPTSSTSPSRELQRSTSETTPDLSDYALNRLQASELGAQKLLRRGGTFRDIVQLTARDEGLEGGRGTGTRRDRGSTSSSGLDSAKWKTIARYLYETTTHDLNLHQSSGGTTASTTTAPSNMFNSDLQQYSPKPQLFFTPMQEVIRLRLQARYHDYFDPESPEQYLRRIVRARLPSPAAHSWVVVDERRRGNNHAVAPVAFSSLMVDQETMLGSITGYTRDFLGYSNVLNRRNHKTAFAVQQQQLVVNRFFGEWLCTEARTESFVKQSNIQALVDRDEVERREKERKRKVSYQFEKYGRKLLNGVDWLLGDADRDAYF
ncbi:unnamed protein product [Amoebophrya sp. A120]|nr:unnamed protein product [Amoebophrya sp. A120]|eukprot:GSA120T00021093001.1